MYMEKALWPKVRRLEQEQAEGGSGSAERFKVICSPEVPASKDPDLVVANIPFWWFSGLTPTKRDIANGTIKTDFMGDGALVSAVTLPAGGVIFDNDVLYGGYLYQDDKASEIILIVAHQSGEHTVITTIGAEFTVNIPKAGIYVSGQEFMAVNIQWETIHPIDPKYIPALDSITLNSPGGKRFTVTVDDSGTITATET